MCSLSPSFKRADRMVCSVSQDGTQINCPSRVLAKQAQLKAQHDRRAWDRNFFVGQLVMACNMRPCSNWIPAVVIERLGPL